MLNKTSLQSIALGVTVMFGMTATALAQSTNGSISGSVVDPSGALIPQAQVTLSNAAGVSRTVKSGNNGSFTLVHLAPGSYSVSINATGFTPALKGGVQVASDKVTRETIKLGISVNQEIEVSANDDAVLSTEAEAPDATAAQR
jgi:hypothetical protein